MYNFISDNVKLYIIDSFDIQVGSGNCSLKWSAELKLSPYSIKNIIISVPQQSIIAKIWTYDEETKDSYYKEITIEIKDVEIKINSNLIDEEIYPKKVEIYQNKITVEF